MDGALIDEWKQRHGFWEAKDMRDQLEREIRKKIEQGYPTTNTIFQMPERAILHQKGVPIGLNEDQGNHRRWRFCGNMHVSG